MGASLICLAVTPSSRRSRARSACGGSRRSRRRSDRRRDLRDPPHADRARDLREDGVTAKQMSEAPITYGGVVTVRSSILEVKEKALRFRHEMCRDSDGEIAAVTVLTGVHLDTVAPRA